ncbi:hypothetical protein GGR57DRAFT_505335 [Xylariaceae sp. FL1272]|nr:hypothetical protein GGR57DRAFT_505335 [Xylariaceae sp. FL1272]
MASDEVPTAHALSPVYPVSDGQFYRAWKAREARKESQAQAGAAALEAGASQERACTACTGTMDSTLLAGAPCGHEYCAPCMRQLFTTSIANNSCFPPRCCRVAIPAKTNRKLLGDDLFKEFQEKAVEILTRKKIYCHRPDCSSFLPYDPRQGRVAVCNNCDAHTCTDCRGACHEGDCPPDPDLQEVLRIGREEGWQQCPECSTMVERIEGCPEMTCTCQASFCYNCGAVSATCRCIHDAYLDELGINHPLLGHPNNAGLDGGDNTDLDADGNFESDIDADIPLLFRDEETLKSQPLNIGEIGFWDERFGVWWTVDDVYGRRSPPASIRDDDDLYGPANYPASIRDDDDLYGPANYPANNREHIDDVHGRANQPANNRASLAHNGRGIAYNGRGIAHNGRGIVFNSGGIANNRRGITINRGGTANNRRGITINRRDIATEREGIRERVNGPPSFFMDSQGQSRFTITTRPARRPEPGFLSRAANWGRTHFGL